MRLVEECLVFRRWVSKWLNHQITVTWRLELQLKKVKKKKVYEGEMYDRTRTGAIHNKNCAHTFQKGRAHWYTQITALSTLLGTLHSSFNSMSFLHFLFFLPFFQNCGNSSFLVEIISFKTARLWQNHQLTQNEY